MKVCNTVKNDLRNGNRKNIFDLEMVIIEHPKNC